jgi:hypothetical protein
MDDAVSDRVSRRSVLKGLGIAGCVAALSRSGLARLVDTPTADAVRFAVLGDFGSGDEKEFAIARQMAAVHDKVPLGLIVTAGDNVYPDGAADLFRERFERPFEGILQRKVPLYACLGNHDVKKGRGDQLAYQHFNMQGQAYYKLHAGNGMLDIFVLDSNRFDGVQLRWLNDRLARSTSLWKIAVFHHPLYSSGVTHGSDLELRAVLEPVLVRHGVSAVFSGHDHIYQRVTPQQGIQYFVTGAGGKIRKGDVDHSDSLVAASYDEDSHFMMVEANHHTLRFETITAAGLVIDKHQLSAPARHTQAA